MLCFSFYIARFCPLLVAAVEEEKYCSEYDETNTQCKIKLCYTIVD